MSLISNALKITFEQFVERYLPIQNHIPSTDICDKLGFETYGAEDAFVRDQEPDTIWTCVEGNDGGMFIIPGYRVVNRQFYFVTKKPWRSENIEVTYFSPQEFND